MKSKLQARLKWVIKEYFEQREKNATVKDLERFINNTIRYKSMKYSNSCFTVTISAKADDVFEIAYNDPVGNGFTRAFAAAGAAGGATGGGPLLIVLGAAVGGATGAAAKVAWDALKSKLNVVVMVLCYCYSNQLKSLNSYEYSGLIVVVLTIDGHDMIGIASIQYNQVYVKCEIANTSTFTIDIECN